MKWKYVVALLVIMLALGAGIHLLRQQMQTWAAQQPWRQASKRDETRLSEAMLAHQSAVAVTVTGRVVKLLADAPLAAGTQQRFMLEIGSGQTVPVQYNATSTNRITGLAYGSQVTVSGQYDWDAQGGRLRCTAPRAPADESGWIEFRGRRYVAAAAE